MAKIIKIATGTYKEGVNEIGDIVSIHDDDVDTGGPGYENFDIDIVDGLTAAEVWASLEEVEESE